MASNINFPAQTHLSWNDMKMRLEAEVEMQDIFENSEEQTKLDPELAKRFPEVEAEVNRLFQEAMSGPIVQHK